MGFADTELDKMIVDARAELDLAERAAKNMEIQRHIADNAYVIQVYQYPLRWEIWWNYVEGLCAAGGEHPLLRAHDLGEEVDA